MNFGNLGFSRRQWIMASIGASVAGAFNRKAFADTTSADKTDFQLACMTLPYAAFPLRRALSGIQSAGFRYVAWGTTHQEIAGGERVPVMPPDATPERAKELAKECRDLGLEPVMMFSTVYPEAVDGLKVLTQRIKQAGAAGIAQVLTFGHTSGGNRDLWIQRLDRKSVV